MKTINYNNSEIRFGNLTESGFNSVLNSERFKSSKKIIITDETVFELWMEHFVTEFDGLSEAEIIQLPAGESTKSLEICQQVWEALSEYEIGRNDLIINIGGGMITDLGGFIAATFKRGVSFINVPTTLLAQVDASVGGKTGIDLGPFKNQIGVFADADYVFIDTAYLSTLADIEIESGYAEMLKHGLIAYKNYWSDLIKTKPQKNSKHLLDLIRTSVSIKRDIVAEDHEEYGKRKNLNFGHTVGHALEGLMLVNNTPIPHGYGVAWGMIAESYLSKESKLLTVAEFTEIDT
ncbi:3-dehydroquinate synthase, partial [Crocinitomix sp.]|nr:3-dehydroquinate synthase [Crocinitomix sp.]